MNYSNKIFANIDGMNLSAQMCSFLVGVANVVFTVFGAFVLLHKIGRRTLMIIGNAGMGIAVVMTGIGILEKWGLV